MNHANISFSNENWHGVEFKSLSDDFQLAYTYWLTEVQTGTILFWLAALTCGPSVQQLCTVNEIKYFPVHPGITYSVKYYFNHTTILSMIKLEGNCENNLTIQKKWGNFTTCQINSLNVCRATRLFQEHQLVVPIGSDQMGNTVPGVKP